MHKLSSHNCIELQCRIKLSLFTNMGLIIYICEFSIPIYS